MLIVSDKEKFRLEILEDLKSGQLDRAKAAKLMGVSLRQLDRIRASYAKGGLSSLAHGNRGRPSNRAMPAEREAEILRVVGESYRDFGPTLASEKLLELHGLRVSVEKLRQMMIAEGLWKGKKRHKQRVHQRRVRRSRRGELVQGDASPHDWFEGRGPRCDLVSFIDDATGYITARFEPSETFEGYCRLLQSYVEEHGCPEALYVDKSSIFRVNHGKGAGATSTAFGKIAKRLKIELICAHSPQAKGRVERMYGSFQDRVVKEMRLANVCTIEEANEFLAHYLPIYNQRFSKEPASPESAHHEIPESLDLYEVLTRVEERKLSKSLDFSFGGTLYQVINCNEPRRLMNQPVAIFIPLDGKMWAECRGRRLEIKPFSEVKDEPPSMNRKQVDAWLNRKPPMTIKQRRRRKIAVPA